MLSGPRSHGDRRDAGGNSLLEHASATSALT